MIIIGDGLIQHRELQHVMRACMEENGMQFSEDQVSGHIYLKKKIENRLDSSEKTTNK